MFSSCSPSTEHLREIAAEVRPVIVALEQYRQEHGGYPETLAQLSIPSVPSRLQYRRDSNFWEKDERTYELEVPVSSLATQWFIYWPEEKYPDGIFGGVVIEIVDGWCLFTS